MVPKMAMVIPKAAIKFPFRADFGEPSIFNPKIKVKEETRYIT